MVYKLRGLICLWGLLATSVLVSAQEEFQFDAVGRPVEASDWQGILPIVFAAVAIVVIVNVVLIMWGIRNNRSERD